MAEAIPLDNINLKLQEGTLVIFHDAQIDANHAFILAEKLASGNISFHSCYTTFTIADGTYTCIKNGDEVSAEELETMHKVIEAKIGSEFTQKSVLSGTAIPVAGAALCALAKKCKVIAKHVSLKLKQLANKYESAQKAQKAGKELGLVDSVYVKVMQFIGLNGKSLTAVGSVTGAATGGIVGETFNGNKMPYGLDNDATKKTLKNAKEVLIKQLAKEESQVLFMQVNDIFATNDSLTELMINKDLILQHEALLVDSAE